MLEKHCNICKNHKREQINQVNLASFLVYFEIWRVCVLFSYLKSKQNTCQIANRFVNIFLVCYVNSKVYLLSFGPSWCKYISVSIKKEHDQDKEDDGIRLTYDSLSIQYGLFYLLKLYSSRFITLFTCCYCVLYELTKWCHVSVLYEICI